MGTHPIFESDFDCLTECHSKSKSKSGERWQVGIGRRVTRSIVESVATTSTQSAQLAIATDLATLAQLSLASAVTCFTTIAFKNGSPSPTRRIYARCAVQSGNTKIIPTTRRFAVKETIPLPPLVLPECPCPHLINKTKIS